MMTSLSAFFTPLVPWLILAGGALVALLGFKAKVSRDAVAAKVKQDDVARAANVVKAVTQRHAVDISAGAASPIAIGDELRRQDRPERPV